ncbi:LPXTG cell wall anchor domain-containing protein [Listeria booriae]
MIYTIIVIAVTVALLGGFIYWFIRRSKKET